MAQKQIPCKTCGKLFTPCAYCVSHYGNGAWRAVACSLECGIEYFRAVEEAREAEKKSAEQKESPEKPKRRTKKVSPVAADVSAEEGITETTISETDHPEIDVLRETQED